VEFGITVDDGLLGGYEKAVLRHGNFIYLSKDTKIPPGAQEFLITGERPETLLLARYYQKQYEKDLQIAMEVDSWEVMARLAWLGFGAAFVPDFLRGEPLSNNLKEVRFSFPQINYDLCAIYRQGDVLSRNVQLFVEVTKKFLKG
jgi:DNA-binding transcriptional LysR family regulator